MKWNALARADVVFDATNVVALLLIGAGVWLAFSAGAALSTVGALVLGLNFLTAKRGT